MPRPKPRTRAPRPKPAKRGPGRPRGPEGMERLTVKVPGELKHWLEMRAALERRDMGLLITEALQDLEAKRTAQDRRRDRRRLR